MVFKEIVFGTAEYRLECALRLAVLRKPLGLSFTAEELAKEKDQLHFGLFEPEDNLVACVVAVRLSPTDARIRQMAVSPAHQRRGLGTRIMKGLWKELEELNGPLTDEMRRHLRAIGLDPDRKRS